MLLSLLRHSEQVETRIDLATVAGDSSFHHIITQPGSYYLSGNLEVIKANGGVEINAVGVTLDLNGHEIFRGSNGTYGLFIKGGMASGFIYSRRGRLRIVWFLAMKGMALK